MRLDQRDSRLCAILVLALLTFPLVADSQGIQKWRTKEGKLYFGDKPPPESELVGEVESGESLRMGTILDEPGEETGSGADEGGVSATLLRRGFQIDRVWSDYGVGKVLVTFRNATGITLDWVQFHCTAIGSGGRRIATGSAGFYSFSDGRIRPGFQGSKEVIISLSGAEMKSASCRVAAKAL